MGYSARQASDGKERLWGTRRDRLPTAKRGYGVLGETGFRGQREAMGYSARQASDGTPSAATGMMGDSDETGRRLEGRGVLEIRNSRSYGNSSTAQGGGSRTGETRHS